jgi:hypothetical protein
MQYPPRNIDSTCFNWVKLILKTELKSEAKYLALYLSTFMNMNQDMAFPSLKRIETETSLSHPTVLKYLKLLESEGWIVKKSGSRTESNRYFVNIPNADQIRVGNDATYVTSEEKVGSVATSNNKLITIKHSIREQGVLADNWDDWEQHRKEIKKKLTPTTIGRQAKQLAKHPKEIQEAMIEQSITNGWTGLFDLKERPNENSTGNHSGNDSRKLSAVERVRAAYEERERDRQRRGI